MNPQKPQTRLIWKNAPASQLAEEVLLREVIKLNRNVLGILCGLAIFVATILLVFKDGPHGGAHFQLLNQFFSGYSVTTPGSALGFSYVFVFGDVSGVVIATIYNSVALLRHSSNG